MSINLLNLPPHLQRYVLLGMPAFGLLAGIAIAVPRYYDLRDRNNDLTVARTKVVEKRTTLAQLKNLPLGPTIARLPATREEPVRFLHNLNALAAQCRVRIVGYTAAAPPTPNPASMTGSTGASPSPAPGVDGLPVGTTPAVLTISAEGTYASIALFFSKLETYSRLLSVSQVNMSTEGNNYPLIKTQFQLTRYLGAEETTQPGAAPAAPAVPTPAPTPSR